MTTRTNEEWLADLQQTGPAHEQALLDLRNYMLRGVMGYLNTRTDLQHRDPRDLDQLGQDAVQDALLKAQEKLASFRGQSRFTTWATKIAINNLISELRRRHWRNVSLQAVIETGTSLEEIIPAPEGGHGNPSRSIEKELIWQSISQVIENDLTDRQREALTLTQLNGVPLKQAAEMLNTNSNNLYKLIHDARLKMKKKLIAKGLDPAYILDLFAGS